MANTTEEHSEDTEPPPEDGGEIEQRQELKVFDARLHKATTAKALAMGLLLGGGFLLLIHYVLVFILILLHKPVEAMDNALKSWLPVAATLVSSAATFYYSKSK